MAAKVSPAQAAKWKTIATLPYSDQGIWVLNGFWEEISGEAENVWKWVELFAKLDQEKGAAGNSLDEFWSHKFLETLGTTMTVIQMRELLRAIDVDSDKKMSLIEFLIHRFKKSVAQVISASQGDNKKEVDEAQAKVEEAQRAVEQMVQRLQQATESAEASKAAAAEAQKTAAAATAAADDARDKAETASQAAEASRVAAAEAERTAQETEKVAAPYRAAVAENETALAELKKQEDDYAKAVSDLEKKSTEAQSVVQRNKAANELQQLKSKDPLPLSRAKINQSATVRKMEKAAAPFNAADAKAKAAAAEAAEAAAAAERSAAEAAEAKHLAEQRKAEADESQNAAEAAANAAEEDKNQAERSVGDAERMLAEAHDLLEAVKNKGGVARGAIWWMERSLTEKMKYMPAKRRL
ncbi:TolA protein [Pelomyxa schiedti]|nr:TolA protein [Pelomyxa schiedti]